ncbi:MAG: hypothetical protein R2851_09630 [Caldilineaceae bacterium]
MVDDLGERGAEALLMPGIATVPLESTELTAALADIALRLDRAHQHQCGAFFI